MPTAGRGLFEFTCRSAKQHQPVNALLVEKGETNSQCAAERITHERSLLYRERVHDAREMAHPKLDVVLASFLELGEAETGNVRHDHMKVFAELVHHALPVGPAGHPGTGTVQQEQGFAPPELVIVRPMIRRYQHLAHTRQLAHSLLSSSFPNTYVCVWNGS